MIWWVIEMQDKDKKNMFLQNEIMLNGTFFVDENYSKEHAHIIHLHKDVLEVLYIHSGEGRYLVGNREYAVKKGDIIICNAGVLHGEAPFQKHAMQTYCCGFWGIQVDDLALNCLSEYEEKPVYFFDDSIVKLDVLMPMIHMLSLNGEKVLANHFALGILSFIYTCIKEKKEDGNVDHSQKKENLVREITNYIDQNYHEKLTLETISNELHISASHLSHLFKSETGLSPMQYVVHRRIGEAQSLLMETNLPIWKIEEKLGFCSSVHFSMMFKKYIGISPKEYRSHFEKK